jgi:hypothetical protein
MGDHSKRDDVLLDINLKLFGVCGWWDCGVRVSVRGWSQIRHRIIWLNSQKSISVATA